MQNSVPHSGPRSVDRAIDVLMALRAAHGRAQSPDTSAGVTELAARVGLPKSTAHRLLQSLAARGLVESTEDGQYRLGFGLVELGLSAQEGDPLVRACDDALREVALRTGETSFLVADRGGVLRVLARAEGHGFLRAMPEIGAVIPLHATATGRLYLAHAPGRVASQLDDGELERFTDRTPTRRSLDRQIARAKRRGWDINAGEWMPDVSVIAAPILVGPRLWGTVAVATPSTRVKRIGEASLAMAVCDAADLVAARLQVHA